MLETDINLVPVSEKSPRLSSTPGRESFSKQALAGVKRFARALSDALESSPYSCIVLSKYLDEYQRIKFCTVKLRAHRLAYELFRGPIPDGLFACHTCDNPVCVNPNHLFPGTNKDNCDDRDRKGRTARGRQKPQTIIPQSIINDVRRYRSMGWTEMLLSKTFGVSPGYVHELLVNPNRRIPGT